MPDNGCRAVHNLISSFFHTKTDVIILPTKEEPFIIETDVSEYGFPNEHTSACCDVHFSHAITSFIVIRVIAEPKVYPEARESHDIRRIPEIHLAAYDADFFTGFYYFHKFLQALLVKDNIIVCHKKKPTTCFSNANIIRGAATHVFFL